jgi:radical SAM superfamily enzyme with C-terminal helix-hairpin-helix motif
MRFTDEMVLDYGKRTFREIEKGESIADYRKAVADNTQAVDKIEAHEIRTGKPWDEWTHEDKSVLLNRRYF